MKNKIHFQNIDGLRFFCFLSVFFFHSFHTNYEEIKSSSFYYFIKFDLFGNGNLGVNFFFVLSGFLITFLLIKEKELNEKINIKKFWIRRILRIWPLYFFCVFFGFVIFPFLKKLFGQIPNETANPWYYIGLINNFDFIKKGPPDASILGVLWSVAIEEQFYFIWPLILHIFPKKKYWIPFTLIIISSLFFRARNDSYTMHEFHTLSCIGDMATGAFGAWLITQFEKFKNVIEYLKKILIVIIYSIFLLIYLFRNELFQGTYITRIFEREFIAIVILLIILEQSYSKNSLFKMSNLKVPSKLGLITYGCYCFQFIGILITINTTRILGINKNLWQTLLIDTPISLIITIIISMISYRFFETPFLNLKEKFTYITK